MAVIVAVIYFLFFNPSAPSCTDGEQNQNEEGIDCGGPCALCEAEKKLEVLSQIIIPTTDNNYDLAAKIKNPNYEWGADAINYQFDLYDSAGQIIASKTGKTYILSQETKYVIEPKFYSEKLVAKTEFKFNNISWKKLEQIGDVELHVDAEYQILEDGSSVLAGTVENRSSYDLGTIEVVGVLLDENNKIIAVGRTSMNTVVKNENRGFEIFWPYPIIEEVKSFDARAYTNVFLIGK